jgi:hypothetical protein
VHGVVMLPCLRMLCLSCCCCDAGSTRLGSPAALRRLPPMPSLACVVPVCQCLLPGQLRQRHAVHSKRWSCAARAADLEHAAAACLQGRVSFFVGVQLDITLAEEQEEGATVPRKVATPASADAVVAGAGASWCAVAAAAAQEAEATCKAGKFGLAQKTAHMSVTGAIRVAVRSLGGEQGLRRSSVHQGLPRATTSPLASKEGSRKSIGSPSFRSLPDLGTRASDAA